MSQSPRAKLEKLCLPTRFDRVIVSRLPNPGWDEDTRAIEFRFAHPKLASLSFQEALNVSKQWILENAPDLFSEPAVETTDSKSVDAIAPSSLPNPHFAIPASPAPSPSPDHTAPQTSSSILVNQEPNPAPPQQFLMQIPSVPSDVDQRPIIHMFRNISSFLEQHIGIVDYHLSVSNTYPEPPKGPDGSIALGDSKSSDALPSNAASTQPLPTANTTSDADSAAQSQQPQAPETSLAGQLQPNGKRKQNHQKPPAKQAASPDKSKKAKTEMAPNGFAVMIYYGSHVHDELTKRLACISCDMTNQVAQTALLSATNYHRLWIDAKGRPTHVVTPIRHVERLSELSDAELFEFWFNACELLRQEQGRNSVNGIVFKTLVVNHGRYRNLAHLHMKIRWLPNDFWAARKKWSPEKKARFQRIQQLASDAAVLKGFIGGKIIHTEQGEVETGV